MPKSNVSQALAAVQRLREFGHLLFALYKKAQPAVSGVAFQKFAGAFLYAFFILTPHHVALPANKVQQKADEEFLRPLGFL